jgi:Na+/pantothenate symporter
MRNWENLSLIQKVVIGLLITIAAAFAPELMMLVDFGGIELAFSFLLVYCKPLIVWLQPKVNWVSSQINIAKAAFLNSALCQPKVFTTHAVFCSVAMVLTGSFVLSIALFLPALMANGILV